MDPVTMTFYAVICGALAAVSPNLGPRLHRAGYGILVGALAAFALPSIRAAIGI